MWQGKNSGGGREAEEPMERRHLGNPLQSEGRGPSFPADTLGPLINTLSECKHGGSGGVAAEVSTRPLRKNFHKLPLNKSNTAAAAASPQLFCGNGNTITASRS